MLRSLKLCTVADYPAALLSLSESSRRSPNQTPTAGKAHQRLPSVGVAKKGGGGACKAKHLGRYA